MASSSSTSSTYFSGDGKEKGGIGRDNVKITPITSTAAYNKSSRKANEEGVIEVLEFAKARINEIEEMKKALKTFRGVRRVYQTLPRHLRRRTMGWDVKRMPRRLRNAASRELDETKKSKKQARTKRYYRKYKRRPKFLLMNHARRQKKYHWLESHMWHAKRFKMTGMWGFKLAEYCRQRGGRAGYRATAHQCTIYDASYLSCIELFGSEASIIALLRLFAPNSTAAPFASQTYLDGSRQGIGMFYRANEYPLGLISPYYFLWRQDSLSSSTSSNGETEEVKKRVLWLWFHPAAFEYALSALERNRRGGGGGGGGGGRDSDVLVTSRKEQVQRFELSGPTAHAILRRVLKVSAISPRTEDEMNNDQSLTGNDLWRSMTSHPPGSLPTGAVLGLTVRDPRRFFPPKTKPSSSSFPLSTSTFNPSSQDPPASSIPPSWLVTWPQSVASCPKLWNKEEREEGVILTQAQVNELRSVSSATLKLKKRQKQKGTTTVGPSSSTPQVVGILLVQRPGGENGFGLGWDIILPAGWSMAFWNSLVYAGARAIGLNEWSKMRTEAGLPNFPTDFPDSVTYPEFQRNQIRIQSEKYYKRPKAKRVSFLRYAIPSPFSPNWHLLAAPSSSIATSSGPSSASASSSSPSLCVFRDNNLLLFAQHLSFVLTSMHLQRISSSSLVSASPSSKPLVRWAVKAPRPSEFHIKLPREIESIHLEGRGLLRSSLTTARRGKPEDNAMICLPTNEDYKNWLLDPKAQLQLLEPVHKVKKEKKQEKKQKKQEKARKKEQEKQEKQKNNKEMRKKNKDSMDIGTLKEEKEKEKEKDGTKGTNQTKVQKAKEEEVEPPFEFSVIPSREVIGFVTRGDFSFIRGKGHALGFVTSVGFTRLLSNSTSPSRANRLHPTFVLLRNSNSRRYIPAFLSLIS